MSDISTLTTTTRNLVQDFALSQIPGDLYTYAGSAVFTISEPNVIAVTAVLKNGSAIASGDYSFSSTTLRVTVTTSLSAGDTVEIQYTYYPNYSDAEIEAYIRSAVVHLSVNNYYTFEVDVNDNFYPPITDKESNLVAFVASILIKPENQTIRLPDITINVPNNLPTRDIISKAVRIFKHNTHGVFDIVGTGEIL